MNDLINQFDKEVLTATKHTQENENMNFIDVSLDDTASYLHSASNLCTTKNGIERLWESKNELTDHRLSKK